MVRLSPEEKAEIRRLAAKGLPVREIARQMGRPPTTIVDFIERTQRLTSPVRERSVRQLCLAEREEISRGLAEGRSVRVIAARIGVGSTGQGNDVWAALVIRHGIVWLVAARSKAPAAVAKSPPKYLVDRAASDPSVSAVPMMSFARATSDRTSSPEFRSTAPPMYAT